MDPLIAELIAAESDAVLRQLEALVAVSTPSGDIAGAEAAVALCASFLPTEAVIERIPCSTAGCAPDLLARVGGTGHAGRRLLLLGHLDTVVAHEAHAPMRADGDRLFGPGTADMKGGDAIALAVARALTERCRDRFAELSVLLVCDEEWRTAPFAHVERFAGYDACLCFEAGERAGGGEEGVIVRRKGAGTLRVSANGRAAHSGSAPQDGRNALLALARTSIDITALADPAGPDRLTIVPTVMRSGQALNVVPPDGELLFDLRSDELASFERARAAVPQHRDEVALEARMERVWPPMDSLGETAGMLAAAAQRLGRPIVPRSRGGASDASHFASAIPLTVDGLGPRGGGAHTPNEFVWAGSLRERLEVALAVALAALDA